MSDTAQASAQSHSLREYLRLLGPGIMAASAAIGGSHLVSSTQAGALFGWQLFAFVLLINVLKYPFFRAGTAYTMSAGEDLIAGYARLGKPIVWIVWALDIFGGIVSTAAVMIFSAALLNYFIPVDLSMQVLTIIIAALTFFMLVFGHYQVLAKVSRWIILLLTIATVAVVIIAAFGESRAPADFVSPSPWNMASLGFIVMLMGWMPSPIDVTALTSTWIVAQKKYEKVTKASALFDFNLGFFVTTALALVFVAMGALIIHGSPDKLAMNGVGFTKQLIGVYGNTIGHWTEIIIAFIAFLSIWGSTITVADGYARVVSTCQEHLFGQKKEKLRQWTVIWITVEIIFSILLNFYFKNEMLVMLKFAMISAFVTTPILAVFNYILMTGQFLKPEDRYGTLLKIWCWIGFAFLWGFLALFIWWQWLR